MMTDVDKSAHRSRLELFRSNWQPILGVVSSILGIASFILVMTRNTIGPVATAIIVILVLLSISVFTGVSLRSQFSRLTDELLDRVGEKQILALDAYTQRLDLEKAELQEQLGNVSFWPRVVDEMSSISLLLRQIEHEARESTNPEELTRDRLHSTLVRMAEMFKSTCGAECRVCIKMIYAHKDEKGKSKQAVRAVGRSNNPYEDVDRDPDYLTHNSDFKSIYFDRKSYWMSSNIHDRDATPGYVSTSNERPYHSVLVWPLRRFRLPPENAPTSPFVDGYGDIIGFVCLDTLKIGAFSSDRELRLGWWYVDLLAVVVDQLVEQGFVRI